MSSLHKEFVAAANYVRQRLGQVNVNTFGLTISAEGRTETGRSNVKIEYDVMYDYSHVTGGSLIAVVDEVLRRKGWHDSNKPLALPEPDGDEVA